MKLKRLLMVPAALILVAVILVLGASAVTYFRARRLFAAAASLRIGDTERHAREVVESVGGNTANSCSLEERSWVCRFSAETGQDRIGRFLGDREFRALERGRKTLARYYLSAERGARIGVYTENGQVASIFTELSSDVSSAAGVVIAERLPKDCKTYYRTRPRPNTVEWRLGLATTEVFTWVRSSAPAEMQKKALLMNASCATYIRNCSARQMLSLQCALE